MALRASKPSFNVREKLTELGRRFGLKGSELAAAETVQDARDIIGAGRRNLCINGNFKCWQRGTSIAAGATGNSSNTYKYVTADRWQTYFYNSYARQDVVLPNGEKVYALRETFNVTRNFFAHIIEDGGRIWNQGGDITISFWARTSGKTTGVSLGFYWYDDWAGSAYTHDTPRKNIIIEGSEWKHYSVTKKLSPNANNRANLAIEFDNNAYGSWSQLTSGEWWEFANVQIEKGKVATEFEQRSVGEELALCERYFQLLSGGNEQIIGTGFIYSASAAYVVSHFRTTMRDTPTIFSTLSGGARLRINAGLADVNTGSNPTINASISSTNAVFLDSGGFSGLTDGHGCTLRQYLGGGVLGVQAEL